MTGSGAMPTVRLPSGVTIPALGQGSWQMAERRSQRRDEVAALRTGLDLGMTLIDTAEMYANGRAEELVAEAIAGRRDEVFLVSKVLPTNASRRGTIEACERSLRRLATDRLDLYLLHWPGSHPIGETVAAFVELVDRGRIRSWGVSNFDARDLDALLAVTGGDGVATDQVLYNLGRRGIEHDLLPWSRRRRMPVMAYSPIDQAALVHHPAVRAVAADHGATAAQVALAWVLRQDGVCTIPKASSPAHVRDNRGALSLELTAGDLERLDVAFPPPGGPEPLEVL